MVHGAPGVQGSTIAPKTLPASLNPWVRNQYWPDLPTPTGQEVLGLFAVFQGQNNFFAVTINVNTGQYLIERGDGTQVLVNSSNQANYDYDYNNPNLYSHPNLPYKIAIVRITPATGQNFATILLAQFHNQAGLASGYSIGWLEIKVSHTSVSQIGVSAASAQSKFLENVEILNGSWIPANGFLASNSNLRRAHLQFTNTTDFSFASLFINCYSLTDVKIDILGAGKVNALSSTFNGCSALVSAPFFDTSKSITCQSMFNGCFSLTTVPLYDLALTTNASNMFSNCTSLVTVPLFNTVAVTTMQNMFLGCYSLTTVPLFNTAAVTNMTSMFGSSSGGCTSLVTVPLFNTASVTNMAQMFYGCHSLANVPLFNTASVTTMSQTFLDCRSLVTVPLFNLAAVTTMASTFAGCLSLEEIPLFNTSGVQIMTTTFNGCGALRTLPALNFGGVTSAANMTPFTGTKFYRVRATGARFTHSIANNYLSGPNLDNYYVGLATVVGQTITVTGNYGTPLDDPTIATNKGWTVTGS
jgi:surface protein